MQKLLLALTLVFSTTLFFSCSRKTTPQKAEEVAEARAEEAAREAEEKAKAAAAAKAEAERKVATRPVVKTSVPKVITVSDQAAKRAVNGRYYYDLDGKRYWRNNKDGKYYLYYKGMFDNKDFQ